MSLRNNNTQNISEGIPLHQEVVGLLDAMAQALHLGPEAEPLNAKELGSRCERSDNCRKTVMLMMNVVVECGYFIQTYVKNISFRMCLCVAFYTEVLICHV